LRFPSLGIAVKQFLTAPIQKEFPSAWMKFPTTREISHRLRIPVLAGLEPEL